MAIGSSDDVGSSINRISGFNGEGARDAEALLLTAGEVRRRATFRRLETLSHSAAATSDDSAASSSNDFFLMPLNRSPDTTLS